jgi:Fusaric acid resistance protein-like/Protein of unknown function (DUF1697)
LPSTVALSIFFPSAPREKIRAGHRTRKIKPIYIALLRGVNAGGNVLKIDRLRALCAELGMKNVRTYVQSGNVVFGKTTVAAVASLLIARLLRLPESYWASITAVIVMQSTLGAAWTISRQRLAGTAIGAAAGALLATYPGQNAAVFGVGVFICRVICALPHMGRNAFRCSGITFAIILLVVRSEPAWLIAMHRFIEISIGIAVGLVLAAVWPERQPAASRREAR